jgi:preprotein translocase subunit YajC
MDPLTLAMIAVLIVAGYFLIIRPQRKRAKDAAELQSSLQAGSRVMMSGGIFGTLKHLGDKQVVVEVSPGVELTFVRQAIIRPLKDDEDEFEYADVAEPESVEPSFEDAALITDPAATSPFANEAPIATDEVAAEPEAETGRPTDKLADQG